MNPNLNHPEKPLCLRKQAAALTIERAINSAASKNSLSFTDLEEILYRYYVEAQRGAEKECRNAETAYNRQVAEYQRYKAEEEKEVEQNGRNERDTDRESHT